MRFLWACPKVKESMDDKEAHWFTGQAKVLGVLGPWGWSPVPALRYTGPVGVVAG